jgi:hypothetical protein
MHMCVQQMEKEREQRLTPQGGDRRATQVGRSWGCCVFCIVLGCVQWAFCASVSYDVRAAQHDCDRWVLSALGHKWLTMLTFGAQWSTVGSESDSDDGTKSKKKKREKDKKKSKKKDKKKEKREKKKKDKKDKKKDKKAKKKAQKKRKHSDSSSSSSSSDDSSQVGIIVRFLLHA